MKQYLTLWTENLLARPGQTIPSRIDAIGEVRKSLGPNTIFARVDLYLEPAADFEIVDFVPHDPVLEAHGYPNWFVFGLLDIIMLAPTEPIRNVRIALTDAVWNRVSTSPMAFLLAGRDAGKKIITALSAR